MFGILKFLTYLKLFFTANYIGEDSYKNKYYESKKRKDYLGRKKRFCIFNGIVEASKIPSNWHAWIHHNSNVAIEHQKYFWMKSHIPNLTGTLHSFQPNHHTQFNVYGNNSINKNKNYTPWNGTISDE